MKIKITLSIFLMLLSTIALAEANVCINQTGKKVFSDTPCEKHGMQSAKSDFPVMSQDSVQPVFVVTNPDTLNDDLKKTPKLNAATKKEKRASPWSSDVPLTGIAWLLISLMPIAAILFLGFHLFMFIKARLRKYRHVRSSMGN
jgi:hypothetical protein